MSILSFDKVFINFFQLSAGTTRGDFMPITIIKNDDFLYLDCPPDTLLKQKIVSEDDDLDQCMKEIFDGLSKYSMYCFYFSQYLGKYSNLTEKLKIEKTTAIRCDCLSDLAEQINCFIDSTDNLLDFVNFYKEPNLYLKSFLNCDYKDKNEMYNHVENEVDKEFLDGFSLEPEDLYKEEKQKYGIENFDEWENLKPSQQKTHLRNYIFGLLGDKYGFKVVDTWNPYLEKSFTILKENLGKGPLIARGFFGRNFYIKAPEKQGESLEGRKVYGWEPKSRKKEEEKKEIQCIILVGVKKRDQKN
jgi:hypothetical protein